MSRDVHSRDQTATKFVTNNVTINLNIFRTFMEDKILNNVQSGLIITIKGSLEECKGHKDRGEAFEVYTSSHVMTTKAL